MQFKVQFALEHRGLSLRIVDDILMHAVEQLVGSTEFDFRRAGEIMVAADARGHLTGGAATAIAEAVEQDCVAGKILVQEIALRIHELVHAHRRAVGVRGGKCVRIRVPSMPSHMNEWCGNLVVSFHESSA